MSKNSEIKQYIKKLKNCSKPGEMREFLATIQVKPLLRALTGVSNFKTFENKEEKGRKYLEITKITGVSFEDRKPWIKGKRTVILPNENGGYLVSYLHFSDLAKPFKLEDYSFHGAFRVHTSELPGLGYFSDAVYSNRAVIKFAAYSFFKENMPPSGWVKLTLQEECHYGPLADAIDKFFISRYEGKKFLPTLMLENPSEYEKKLLFKMGGSYEAFKLLPLFMGLVKTKNSSEDVWNIPIPASLAHRFSMDLSSFKKAFREAGGTKKAWSYLCNLKHMDIVTFKNVTTQETLPALAGIMNAMTAAEMQKAPKWCQNLIIEEMLYRESFRGPSSFYTESKYKLIVPFLIKVRKWSKRRSGLYYTIKQNLHAIFDDDGNQILRQRHEQTNRYATDIRGKERVIIAALEWYLTNYKRISRELLQQDFKVWTKHQREYEEFSKRAIQVHYEWECLIEAGTYNFKGQDYLVEPVNSTIKLFKEADSMSHCVDTYNELCAKGAGVSDRLHRIFSVEGPERTTLELRIHKDYTVTAGQNYGYANRTEVATETEEFGNYLAKEYKDLLLEAGWPAPASAVDPPDYQFYKKEGPLAKYEWELKVPEEELEH